MRTPRWQGSHSGLSKRHWDPARGSAHRLLLVCVEEMSYAQAAAILEIPVGTVMSRLARGRATLRQLLEPHTDNKQQMETCIGPAR